VLECARVTADVPVRSGTVGHRVRAGQAGGDEGVSEHRRDVV
jgi:hypothetical protein